ncbi:MAG: hypothetical protein JWO42_3955, partial [Chloroflexi bacterium]|nr:hypothetical protein [Chloroflexota bacterium]
MQAVETESAPVSRFRFAAGRGRLVRLLALVVAVIAARVAQAPGDAAQVPVWVIIASVVGILGAALTINAPFKSGQAAGIAGSDKPLTVAIGAAFLLVPAIVSAAIWSQEPFHLTNVFVKASSSFAAYLWIAGMTAGLLFLWSQRGREKRQTSRPIPWGRYFVELLAILVILDVALGLRVWRLGSLPEGIWFDEADFAMSAQRLFSMPFQPFGPGNVGHNPSLYFYVMAVVMKVAGTSMAAVRLSSALFGTLAVAAVYLLGRKMGGVSYGLCAAALLALSKWAIDFSRFGMSNIAAPAMIGLAFAFLCLAMLRPRAIWFAMAGVILGLSILTYAGGFIAAVLVAHTVVGLRILTDATYRRAAWPGVLLLPAGLIVGAAPFLTSLSLDSDYTLSREQTVSIFTEYKTTPARITALIANLRSHLLMFTVHGDSNGRHNLPGAPMLDPTTGTLFLLGLGICIRSIKHWYAQLLLLWLGASMLGGILSLSFEAPQGARTVGAVAPIALIAALPLMALASWIYHRVRVSRASVREIAGVLTRIDQRPRNAIAAIVATLVILLPTGVVAKANYDEYFIQHSSDLTSWLEMGGLQAIIGRSAIALELQGYTVRISPELAVDPAVIWAAGGEAISAYDPNVPVPLPVPAGGLALIIPATNADVFNFVERSYPSASVKALTPSFDRTQVEARAVLITPGDAERNLGATAVFGQGASATTVSHVVGAATWPVSSGAGTAASLQATLVLGGGQAWQPVSFRVAGLASGTLSIDGDSWPVNAAGTPSLR